MVMVLQQHVQQLSIKGRRSRLGVLQPVDAQLQRALRGWRELAAVVLVLQQHKQHNMQHQDTSGGTRATEGMKPHAAGEC
jgi:hypothetical protein